MKLSHIALATSALLALNGCLKVKDNNNSEMVAQALDKQTTAQQQLAAEQQKKTTADIKWVSTRLSGFRRFNQCSGAFTDWQYFD